jgi:hypothetical protein
MVFSNFHSSNFHSLEKGIFKFSLIKFSLIRKRYFQILFNYQIFFPPPQGKHIGRLGHQDPGEFPEEVKALFEKAVQVSML